jgi:6-phosphofructokinase 1
VAASGVERVRTTAESHRRIAIIEVMGRESGYIALGSAYGQPDLVLIPEHPLDLDRLLDRVLEVYEAQKNVVIVCGEGIRDPRGVLLGAQNTSTDPAGNKTFNGAAEELRQRLIQGIGDRYFRERRRGETAREMIFTRKVGHTQRGGRPLRFDRFHAAQLGGHAVDLLLEGMTNTLSVLQWTRRAGFAVQGIPVVDLLDDWGHIHARKVHPGFYDASRMHVSPQGSEYLQQIFTDAVGHDDTEHLRERLFTPGRLLEPHRSINALIGRRIEYLVGETQGRRASDHDPDRLQLSLL